MTPHIDNGRVIFVTVGTSAAENEELVEGSPALRDRLGETRLRKWLYRSRDNPRAMAEVEEALRAAHAEFWGQRRGDLENPANFRRTSAEAISTYNLAGGSLLRGRDRVVFVVSKTLIGEMCGRLNEGIFREHLFRGRGKEEVVTEIIADFYPGEEDAKSAQPATSFQVYPQIRSIAGKHLDGNEEEAIFNITGSFKGWIPPIAHLATSRKYFRRAQVMYMHDSMDTTVRLTLPREGGDMLESRSNYVTLR